MTAEQAQLNEIAENAKELGAIRLDHLIKILAEDESYREVFGKLWHAYNLDCASTKIPPNEHPSANYESLSTRAGAWFWLLMRYAGITEYENFYFKDLPKRKLLPIYDRQNAELVKVEGPRREDHYVKPEDLKMFFEHISKRHKIDIPLPWRLFGDAIGQLETESTRPNKHSSNRKKSIQMGIDPDHLMLLAAKGQAFTDGPKHNRADNLAKAMKNAWKLFVKDQNKPPTAFELWDWIPIGGNVQEKEPDTQTIYWKSADGSEKTTSFKSFQNRYTNLKKKLTAK